jgi:hypothetical protein
MDISRSRKHVEFTSTPLFNTSNALGEEWGDVAQGAVYTRSEVVDFILDLAGYTIDNQLYDKSILEPSFGGGDFLLPIIQRLVESWRINNHDGSEIDVLENSIRAIELHRSTFNSTRASVISLLNDQGFDEDSVAALADRWLSRTDFLLSPLDRKFDFVVGNPPYIRPENIPSPILTEYRSRYSTMHDRADIYVPFIERSLSMLVHGGKLGFICSDRWMKNRYGSMLRNMIANDFHLEIYVDMVDTPAFYSVVTAYPAIVIIRRGKPGATRVAFRPTINKSDLSSLAHQLCATDSPKETEPVREIVNVASGSNPWLLNSPDQTSVIRRLETMYFPLEDVGCTVGIGVATGADKVYIGDYDALDVETDRKLRLVKTDDLNSGVVKWRGLGVINPFDIDGGLVDLDDYPRLKHYLNLRRDIIASRHCAKNSPSKWYRTIDRINPELAYTPKLLIPDIKSQANVVYEDGHYYPHHNLYYITSRDWDLIALQAVLLSAVTYHFVAAYSTKMRGGCLRFQAQHLRRIHIPRWTDIPVSLRSELIKVGKSRDLNACNKVAVRLYNLNRQECCVLGLSGE